MNNIYIYNNPSTATYLKIITGEDLIRQTRGIVISLCSSYLTAESNEIFSDFYRQNGSNMIIARKVKEEINDPKSNAFHCGYSENKYEITQKLSEVNSDATSFPELLHTENDKEAVLSAKDHNGIAITADFDEVVNASYLTVPFIFRIPEDELKKYNGPQNYIDIFFKKKVGNLLKEINNRKHANI